MPTFQDEIASYFPRFREIVSTNENDWTVKGFIDSNGGVYTISVDTKVVSKVIELMIFPAIADFAKEFGYEMRLAEKQNHYPDITFIRDGIKIALDLKSTYRVKANRVNGMTLGAFTGYFRDRTSTKNCTFAYGDYAAHYILGVLYARGDVWNAVVELGKIGIADPNDKQLKAIEKYLSTPSDEQIEELYDSLKVDVADATQRDAVRTAVDVCIIDERQKFRVEQLAQIRSVVRDIDFFVQEKWKLAIDRPGSGNTKNIGSVVDLDKLINGRGAFADIPEGHKVFDDFWMNYLTKDMLAAKGLTVQPYKNLKEYQQYKAAQAAAPIA